MASGRRPLRSASCTTTEAQDIVASHGIVFPAIASSTKKAVKVF